METNKTSTLLRSFNTTIDAWITALHLYTLEMLCEKPQPDTWSLGQVYVHITNDTQYFIEQMKLAAESNANSDKDMHRDAKAIFNNNGFPDALLTGPATNDSVPQPQSKEALLQSLVSTKEKANRLYTMADIERTTGKSQHPGLGFFSAGEWLQFAEMHMRHHFRQKKRIEDKLYNTVSKTVTINAPVSKVWDTITKPALIKQWMPDVEVDIISDWQPGSPLIFRGDLHGIEFENKGAILQIEPGKVLAYTHWSSLSKQEDKPENYSVITFRLMSMENNTTLTFTQSNIISGVTWKHVSFYWNATLQLIKEISEN